MDVTNWEIEGAMDQGAIEWAMDQGVIEWAMDVTSGAMDQGASFE